MIRKRLNATPRLAKTLVLSALLSAAAVLGIAGQTPSRTPLALISGGVLNGKATSLPAPDYPAAAQAVKASGAVNVQVVVDENGGVVSARAVSGHPLLRSAAETAARNAKFSATTLSGVPVKVSGVIVYNFNPPTPADKKLDIVKLSTFLYIVRSAAEDLNGLNRSMDSVDFIAESLSEFPNSRESLAPMLTLKDLAADKRLAVLDGVIEASRAKGDTAHEWQFQLGRCIGELFSQVFPHISPDSLNGPPINEAELKGRLIRIKELVPQAPSDTSPDVLTALRSLGDMSERPKLGAPENLFELLGNLLKLIDSAAPDEGKSTLNVR